MDKVYDMMNCINKKTGAQLTALIEDDGVTHLVDEYDREVRRYDSLDEAAKEYTIF